MIRERIYRNPVTGVFLLSDGQPTQSLFQIPKLLNDKSIQDSFTVNTFGFGTDHDPQYMSDISKMRDGSFYFIEKLQQVEEAFVGCLGGLMSVQFKNVELEIEIVNDNNINLQLSIAKTFGDMFREVEKNKKYSIRLEQLIEGVTKDFVIEIVLPKLQQGAIGSGQPINFNDANRNQIILKARVKTVTVEG